MIHGVDHGCELLNDGGLNLCFSESGQNGIAHVVTGVHAIVHHAFGTVVDRLECGSFTPLGFFVLLGFELPLNIQDCLEPGALDLSNEPQACR